LPCSCKGVLERAGRREIFGHACDHQDASYDILGRDVDYKPPAMRLQLVVAFAESPYDRGVEELSLDERDDETLACLNRLRDCTFQRGNGADVEADTALNPTPHEARWTRDAISGC
jgi:hypothetical protein